MLGGELGVDCFDAAVVDVGSPLLDRAAGVAFAFGEAGFDEGVDDVEGVVAKPRAADCFAGDVGKDFGELIVVEVGDLGAEEDLGGFLHGC